MRHYLAFLIAPALLGAMLLASLLSDPQAHYSNAAFGVPLVSLGEIFQ
ncbi:hypothetical protein [Pseudomonas sp. LFM046]|nr:hypothetical protein [Pseudomonas sp. LFM046]